MILLGIGHPMLKEQVVTRSGPDNAEYRANNPLEMKIADFDDVTYCLKAVDDNLTVFFSMLGLACNAICLGSAHTTSCECVCAASAGTARSVPPDSGCGSAWARATAVHSCRAMHP
jgi:hypothetical protein